MSIKKYLGVGMVLAAIGSFSTSGIVSADTNVNTSQKKVGVGMMARGGGMVNRGITGTVTAISGSTITVSGRQGFATNTPATVFTVDASKAKIMKDNATGTIASIAVGDTIVVQGTVIGTNVAAITIRDGVIPGKKSESNGRFGEGKGNEKGKNATTSPIIGNGQPVIAGSISAINGSTLSVTNPSGVSYTVDVSSAKIYQGNKVATLANVSVGDTVVIQGTINGSSVTASTLIEQAKPDTTKANGQSKMGFLGGIGKFFSRMFGF